MPAPPLDARVRTARAGARAAAVLARRVRGGSGTVIGGRVLLRAAPSAPSALSRGRRVSLVSGTNGKTTTTALLAAALGEADDRRIGSNRGGANTAAGISGLLATDDAPRLVLEVDEAWLPWTVQQTRPVSVLLMNLTRDQLTRHHEVGSLARAWHAGLSGVPLAIANADDPDVAWSAMATQSQIWVSAHHGWTEDSVVCPRCGGRCRHEPPDWRCDSCGLGRPEPDWWLEGTTLCSRETRVELTLSLPGTFNLANAALAVAAAVADGVVPEEAAARLAALTSVSGRFERRVVGDHDLRLMLAKNPAGWLELLALLAPDPHPVVLLFNADGVDGRDPSWLYDVSFTALRGRQVVVQGLRATDLLVRLELDGVTARHVRGPLSAALTTLPPGRVDVVGNYTAFQTMRAELARA